jgi:outer membrane protein assembly factor BamD (BamD/ComL family)
MKIHRIIVIALIVLGLAACGSKEKEMEKIKTLEKEVFADANGMNKEKAAELVKLYVAFADAHSKDTLAASCLYKAAEMSINLNDGDGAIKYFDRVITEYQDYYKVPEAYFLKGFVYEVTFKNLNKAREAYTDFIKRYPNHDLTDDAEISLNNLGKTPEQIILEAQKKDQAKQDSLAAIK